ncbi:MAG: HlyC/CorC family transporter [Calditrichaeota bacterium]|nr:MAG: HlyC/CorC family transporter [Calditrichota bacterium]
MFYLIVSLIALALSFYFSGTETALVSVNRVRVELWRRRNLPFATLVHRFLEKPEIFLYTTLVGNNIANIAFASFATVYFYDVLKLGPGVGWIVVFSLTLIFGEIFPKTLFRSLADWLARYISLPLQLFYYLFLPVIFLVSRISELLLGLLGHQSTELKEFFTRRDIEVLLQETQSSLPRSQEEEGELISRALEWRNLRVRDIMVPRTQMVAVPEDMPIRELIQVFRKHGFTRLPVFRERLDNIVGIVHVKDLFKHPQRISDILREVLFVPETKRVSELLQELREKNMGMAIVIDEYGGTAGLVTIEDLLEHLFGEITDEHDETEVMIRRLGDQVYSVNAMIEIEELNEALNLDLPEGDYETLAGFLLNQLGHIPKRDEVFDYRGVRFVITRATRRQIQRVRIELKPAEQHH